MIKWMWVLTALIAVAKAQVWRTGRATHYGEDHTGQTDGYSIHDGSCQFGNLDPNIGTGWDIAAISDKHPDFQGSCGKCFELRCKPMIFRDNYGDTLDQRNACLDESKSVLVTVVDVCPCYFPRNLYSNKRWCCGDMDHFDISVFAFQKLAPREAGVIALEYREVPCPSYEVFLPTAPENIHVNSKPASHLTATSAVQRVSRTSTSDATSTQSAIAITLEPVSPEEDIEVEVAVATASQRESRTPVSSSSSATVSGGTDGSTVESTPAVAREDTSTKSGESKEEPAVSTPPAVTPAPDPRPVAVSKPKPATVSKPKPAVKPAPTVRPPTAPKPAPDVLPTLVSDPNLSDAPETVETDSHSGVVSLSIGRWTYRVPENGGQVTRVSRTSSTDTTSTQSVGTSVTTSTTGSPSGSSVSSAVSTRGSASASASASASVSGTRAPVISSSVTQTSTGSTRTSVQSSSTTTGGNTRSSASSSASTGASSYVSTRTSVTTTSGRGSSSASATRVSTDVNGSGARVSRTSRSDTTSTRGTAGGGSSRNLISGDDSWVPQVG